MNKYEKEIDTIKRLNSASKEKNHEKCSEHHSTFVNCSNNILQDFKSFRTMMSEKSETFIYFYIFLHMVSLRDLIRADREGNWHFHLNSAETVANIYVNVIEQTILGGGLYI